MNISTKNIPVNKAGTPKTLQPGNVLAKINSIALEPYTYKPGADYLVLNLEGTDRGAEFEGFFINKDKPDLGRHKGQVGKVKTSEWAYADGTTTSGIVIKKNDEILKFISSLCKELNINWLDDQDGKHATIESLVKAFNTEAPFKNIFMKFCLAGKEYQNKEGYTNYDLFLPKYAKGRVPYEACDKPNSKIIEFNETDHIKKQKAAPVAGFGGDSSASAGSDFEL